MVNLATKTRLLLISTTVALLAAGCGRKDAGTSANADGSDTTANAPAASASGGSSGSSATANEIAVTANDQFSFES